MKIVVAVKQVAVLGDEVEFTDDERDVDPDLSVHDGYRERYLQWREVYLRQLALSEEGLLRPLWRAAGT